MKNLSETESVTFLCCIANVYEDESIWRQNSKKLKLAPNTHGRKWYVSPFLKKSSLNPDDLQMIMDDLYERLDLFHGKFAVFSED
jgi:hypothetical protein